MSSRDTPRDLGEWTRPRSLGVPRDDKGSGRRNMKLSVALASFFIFITTITFAAPPASKPGDSSSTLSGKAAWDPELWKYYCKHEYELDVPDEPQAFPEERELKQVNTEFAIR